MEKFKGRRILVVDDEAAIREILKASLEDDSFVVETAEDGLDALDKASSFRPEIILLDVWMPGSLDGIEVLKRIKTLDSTVEVIVMSGHGTIETAVKATKLGAWDFLEKPLSMDKVFILINNILSLHAERSEKNLLLHRLRKNIALIGAHQKIQEIKETLARMAPTNSWVLITGETGTGKELTAQNLHYLSHRASQPFITVNCAALPEELASSEIFGFEEGAFLGAKEAKKGKLELAHQGTLFLKEVSSLSLDAQQKLLRFLQDKKFTRVGGTLLETSDARIVASSSLDLNKEIAEGRFREDLYFRLNVLSIEVPPLRDRGHDIPSLVQHFSEHFSKHTGYRTKQISQEGMALLTQHSWPGNVRELQNFIERVYILTPTEEVDVSDIRFAGLGSTDYEGEDFNQIPTFREARSKFEKEYILKKLEENSGNISRTAEVIGLERSYLHRKIKAYKIDIGHIPS